MRTGARAGTRAATWMSGAETGVPASRDLSHNIVGQPFETVYWVIALTQSDTDIDENTGMVQVS